MKDYELKLGSYTPHRHWVDRDRELEAKSHVRVIR
jgi:hypothetical protein